MSLILEKVTSESSPAFQDMLRIYKSSIEVSEQKKERELSAMLEDERYLVLVAYQDGVLLGFSISFLPNQVDFWLLEYMAVDEIYRSKGIGAELFLATDRAVAEYESRPLCLLEVDRPRQDAGNSNILRRREKFYRSLDCLAVEPLNYILPLDGTGIPPEMMLMVRGLLWGEPIKRDRAVSWLSALYRDVYNVALYDPRFVNMVSRLPAELEAR